MIQIDNLEFCYGHQGFRLGIPALQISTGEKIAIVGRSGSGKSTLLKLISGVEIPTVGSVRVHQFTVNRMSESQRRKFRVSQVGFVFQEFELIEHLSVRDNIRLPFLINRSMAVTGTEKEHLNSMADWCGLLGLMGRFPHQLSQGERQRVAVCRALITRPRLILADEPTGSLDAQTGNEIMDLLLKQSDELSATLVMVTHDMNSASRLDRTIAMDEFQSTATRAGGQ